MRLFIGIEIPLEVRQAVHDFLVPMQTSPKGWERLHDYHQTLLFIGEVESESLTVVQERLRAIQITPFELQTSGFRFFNRRIMYLGFQSSRELTVLKTEVDTRFSEWINPRSKPFTPHVTVKRWQRYEHDHLVEGINSRTFPSISFTVNGISLFKAEKDSEGNKYHVMGTSRSNDGGLR
ncbi:MAG TPA: RNA 2',3'-cyclic phosphodiesterase [Bacteriovoracaceae bacterium]|nr:RNA 2',3'-cyclic phosphodiesterase [Bacteriovoracaceae bacterium]